MSLIKTFWKMVVYFYNFFWQNKITVFVLRCTYHSLVLTVDCLTHDTTLTELLPRSSQQTYMHTFLQQLQTWATSNKMKINYTKTKEMILGPLAKSPLNCYLTVLLTTLLAWKEYSISNFLGLLSRMI